MNSCSWAVQSLPPHRAMKSTIAMSVERPSSFDGRTGRTWYLNFEWSAGLGRRIETLS